MCASYSLRHRRLISDPSTRHYREPPEEGSCIMSPNLEHQQSSVLTSFSDSPASNQMLLHGSIPTNGIRSGGSDDVDHQQEQLLFVSSYSDFDKLAHGPRGRNAKHTLRTYRFHDDGSLVLLYVGGEGKNVINPAFSRFHPR